MSSTGTYFDRAPGEGDGAWIARLVTDEWWCDASDLEVHDFTDVAIDVIGRIRRQRFRRVNDHARAIAKRIGWERDPLFLVTLALERYLDRFNLETTLTSATKPKVNSRYNKRKRS